MNTPKKKPMKWLLMKHAFLAVAAFITAGVLFLVTLDQVVMPLYLKTGQETDAPDLLGRTVEEAKAVVRRNNLSVHEEKRDFHTSYPENTIYLQIPSPGTKVKPGRRIRIFVSNGPRPIPMPDVVGKSPRNARFAVQDAGLYIREEAWISSNEYPYGTVARQYPEGGQDVPDTTGVILYISNGRRSTNTIMPNLLNLSRSAANDTLRAHAFNMALVRVQKEEQPDLLPDTVIDQYPGPGRPANTNDEVILIVSTAGRKEE